MFSINPNGIIFMFGEETCVNSARRDAMASFEVTEFILSKIV